MRSTKDIREAAQAFTRQKHFDFQDRDEEQQEDNAEDTILNSMAVDELDQLDSR